MADGDRPGGEERPLWVLTRDEQRLLWITFAGGFASIVAGAACIGVAISLARASHYVRPDTRLEILLLAPVLGTFAWLYLRRRAALFRRAPTPYVKASLVFLLTVCSFWSLIGGLALIGIAAGVK